MSKKYIAALEHIAKCYAPESILQGLADYQAMQREIIDWQRELSHKQQKAKDLLQAIALQANYTKKGAQ